MILSDRGYNPLHIIFKYDLTNPTAEALSVIQHELFKGGVVAESAEEFGQVLALLIETENKFYGKK